MIVLWKIMHNPKKKPSRGVCQVCGKPVPAIEMEDRDSCFRPAPTFIAGHEYEGGKLIRVRCPEHWYGLRANTRELNRPATAEEMRLAELLLLSRTMREP